MSKNKLIIQYQRNKKRVPSGVVVAIGPNLLGWSLCHKTDTFTKELARGYALERAYGMDGLTQEETIEAYKQVPHTLQKVFDKVKERSTKYFKEEVE